VFTQAPRLIDLISNFRHYYNLYYARYCVMNPEERKKYERDTHRKYKVMLSRRNKYESAIDKYQDRMNRIEKPRSGTVS
jgi:hypothetical protein